MLEQKSRWYRNNMIHRGKRSINKLLIANNGIAAVKAIRSIRKWSYETFENDRIVNIVVMATPEDLAANAEYSDFMPVMIRYIRMADQYIEVPGGANNNNYANVTRIVEIAEAADVDAVWAGWGHASENPSLPDRLDKKGILFLGPSSNAMKCLGDKIDSTIIAQSAHIPTLPWNGSDVTVNLKDVQNSGSPVSVSIPESVYESVNIHNLEEARCACERVGFPLMIKASEGGGGKGIRTLTSLDELESSFRAVQSEVPGSPIFIMRLAEQCRHLEVQIIADEYGNVISLSGRDCSVQRRHQKIIEEGPPQTPSTEVWEDMQLAAVRLAKLVGYTNAGTVEYLYMEDNSYSFLELNPRLQVEHPVTEMITNVNLPSAQLQIAMGIPLYCIPDIRRLYGFEENDVTPIPFDLKPTVSPKGHVIACRITAENPDAGFQPTSGAIRELNFRSTQNVWGYFSVDGSGRVHEYADSQFGHLFSWGTTREIARKNMVQALREFSIRGEICTTIEYLLQLIQNENYIHNEINTGWLDSLIRENLQTVKPDACFVVVVAAACNAFITFKSNKREYIRFLKRGQIPPNSLLTTCTQEELIYENKKYTIDVHLSGESLLTLTANQSSAQLQIRELPDGGFLLNTNGQSHVAYVMNTPAGIRLSLDGITCVFSQEYDPTVLCSVNSGKLARILVKCGDHLNRGEAFAEMEIMKMYLPLVAQESCTVVKIVKAAGSVVQSGDILGYVQLDDPSKVRRAESFSERLPALSVQKNIQVRRPHHNMKMALSMIQSFINGYWVSVDQVHYCLTTFREAVLDPALPFYEYLDVLSTIEACLPEEMKTELNSVLFSSREEKIASHSTEQENEHSLHFQADGYSDMSFKKEFPAQELRYVLNKFVLLAKNRVELEQRVSPLLQVVRKYSNGIRGFAITELLQLLELFVNNERFVESSCQSETIELNRRNTEDGYCEQVWRSHFSRNQQSQKATLLIEIMNVLSTLIPTVDEESSHFNQLLQDISILCSRSTTSISLEARQILLQRKLPSKQEELEQVRSSLDTLVKTDNPEAKEQTIKKLVEQASDVRQSLMEILRLDNQSLYSVALECYLRKIYSPYVLAHIQPCTLIPNATSFSFDFASESTELPTGIRPSASFSSQDGSPFNSPRMCGEPSVVFAHGVIIHAKSSVQLESDFPSLLQFFNPTDIGDRNMNAVHVVLSEYASLERDETIQKYENLLGQYHKELTTAGISRITITQSSALHPESRWELPTSFTFRQRLNYKEDPLVRHIEPPLAYHLELNRLRNFIIQLVPSPNRNIHLYEATPKEPAVVRGSKLPLRKRFFVRAVCINMDSLETNTIVNTFPSAEKTLVEAMNALEVGLDEARLRGEDKNFGANHIFLNILPPAEVDPNLIEQIMKKLYLRYARRLTILQVTQVEMRILPILSHGAQPIPVRMVGTDPTGMALRIDTYVETKDNLTNSVIFTSINQSMNDVAGELDGHSVNLPYPVLEFLERERAYAQKTSNTLYCYDFLELIQRVLLQQWKTFLRKNDVGSIVMPDTIMRVREFDLSGTSGQYSLKEVVRGPGKNRIGMVAWILTLYTPTYPKEGREIIVIANDITHKAGSFGTKEDIFFHLVSERARELGIPRVFFAANSGARIGLAEEIKQCFRIKWNQEDDPESGVDYLYLTEEDYYKHQKSVAAHSVKYGSQIVYQIDTIIGEQSDLGVENLAGSGLIAGTTSKAYNDIVTLTVVTGRSVGIGAYLVRLGQRTIQKAFDAPIILTGYEALNQLMGKTVYTSNDQLGGTSIMCPNGVTHIRVQNDIEGIQAMLQWLSYIPRTSHSQLVALPLSPSVDIIDRPVAFRPTKVAYDVRHLIQGTFNEEGDWISGLFDKDSFMEVLSDWAKTVVVGRARLGGLPVGVIATENRTVETVIPADPAMPQTEGSVLQQAGGVWYPDSAFKTAQAIEDINQEGLPLFIIANWRGFSGGARDMFQEILKYGSYIVDQLVSFKQPVFVYIPPYGELRGGAFVVVDSHVNTDMIEMYADPDARAGVLEPSGVVSIKFRKADRISVMKRTDLKLQTLETLVQNGIQIKENENEIHQRQNLLEGPYQHVAEVFADLHDRADRMKSVGVIRDVISLERSRCFFYWRLRRRLLETRIAREISEADHCCYSKALSMLSQWFLQSNQHRFNHNSKWEDDEMVYHWMEHERADSIFLHIQQLKKKHIRNEIVQMGKDHPYTVADGLFDLLSSLSDEVKERFIATLKRGILLRNQEQKEYQEIDNFIEFSFVC